MQLFRGNSKPYVRWWWLHGPFTKADILRQLRWAHQHGFGGVELAWLHPGWLEKERDSMLRPRWLSREWQDLVAYTKCAADDLGLGCDFTFGSSWPFGGSWLGGEDAAQTFNGLSDQQVHGSWEEGESSPAPVVNHLSARSLRTYARPLLSALSEALQGGTSALFCDSLELRTEQMWSQDLWTAFEERFGYSLRPFTGTLQVDIDARYDYRKLLDEVMRREFFETFTKICHENNAYSRVQCHGAPVDLLAAYASVDVPESESLLFPPSFSRIPASAAAWAGKQVVSAEAFTCIYGFPGWDHSAEEYWKRETAGDIKLLADALFANGVNQIVWHGMPYQPSGKEVEFYASVHVGPDSAFVSKLAELNRYLDAVCSFMQAGETYGQVGVYLQFEDAWMLDRLSDDEQTPGANYRWEMRHAVPPKETKGYQPLWISLPFLKQATVENGSIVSRHLRFELLYVDCEWMDRESLDEMRRLAEVGARIVWKRACRQPGRQPDDSYSASMDRILRSPKTKPDLAGLPPLLEGDDLPLYWARRAPNDDLMLFLAHPLANEITYPMRYGLSATGAFAAELRLILRWKEREIPLTLRFEKGVSLTVIVSARGTYEILQNRV